MIKIKRFLCNAQKSSIAIFLAATSALTISTLETDTLRANENNLGGLKEWNTDMPIDAEFILDENAQKLADEAAKSSICIPIGEGETAGKYK